MRKYYVQATKRYKRDFKRLTRSGFDIDKLEHVIDLLAAGEQLSARYRDHALQGTLKDTRECHIGPRLVAAIRPR